MYMGYDINEIINDDGNGGPRVIDVKSKAHTARTLDRFQFATEYNSQPMTKAITYLIGLLSQR